MTFTSCAHLRASSKCTEFCRQSCGDMQEYPDQRGKDPRSGTKPACILEVVKFWSALPSRKIRRQACGQVQGCPLNSKGCASWELRWATEISRMRFWRGSPETITSCSREMRTFKAARANYLLRVVRPELVRDFAERHDSSLWTCMCEILRVDPGKCSANARNSATLPLALGGLGLRSAVRTNGPASWASWADALAMIKERHPEVVHMIVGELEGDRRPI